MQRSGSFNSEAAPEAAAAAAAESKSPKQAKLTPVMEEVSSLNNLKQPHFSKKRFLNGKEMKAF